MLDSIINENLFEFDKDKYNNSINNKPNYIRDGSEANLDLFSLRKNEAKSSQKVPEIKIENNNANKNESRFDMPRLNKITFNSLHNFHDEKRKIEGRLIQLLIYYFFSNFFVINKRYIETAGILSEETSHNLNSLSNLIMSNTNLDKNKSNPNNINSIEISKINYNNNFNNAQNTNNEANRYSDHYNNRTNKYNEPNIYREKPIDKNDIIDNNIYHHKNNNNDNNEDLNNKNNQKKDKNNKSDRIIKIIIKIKTCPDTAAIVSQLFGDDVLERIISPDTEEEMISDLEQIISEIEELKANNINNNNTNSINNNNQEIDDNPLDNEKNIQSLPSKQMICNSKSKNNSKEYLNIPLQSNFLGNHKTNLYEYSKNIDNTNSKSNTGNCEENYSNNNNINYTNSINNNNNNNNNYTKKINLTTKDSSNKKLEHNTNPNNHNFNNNLDSVSKYSNDVISENNFMKVSGSKSKRDLNKSQSKAFLDEYTDDRWDKPNFESMLRNYKSKNSNKMIFRHTKKRSEFFDPTLQHGGVSKLDNENRSRRSKSNARGFNDNSSIGKSADKSLIDKSYVYSKQRPNRNVNYRENYQEILGKKEYDFNYD